MMFSFCTRDLRSRGNDAVNDDVKTIAFVLYPGLTPLDLIGPLQVMSGLEVVEATFGMQPRHHVVVVAEHLDPVPTDTPVQVAATTTLDEVPEPFIVMVPGGGAPTLRQLPNPVLLDYLRNGDRTAGMVTSVCTGSLLLAGAGLLQGRPATTHWAYHRFLERLGASYVPQRWVEDGRYLTGAGVSAGIDTALRLAAIVTSDDVARTIQLAIEYNPQPPHGGIDWPHVDRDSFGARVEGFPHQALDDHPDLLAWLLGSETRS
jgi:transcriptional regulator GlxA family with amidase domain